MSAAGTFSPAARPVPFPFPTKVANPEGLAEWSVAEYQAYLRRWVAGEWELVSASYVPKSPFGPEHHPLIARRGAEFVLVRAIVGADDPEVSHIGRYEARRRFRYMNLRLLTYREVFPGLRPTAEDRKELGLDTLGRTLKRKA